MKQIIKKILGIFRLKIERIDNPNPLFPRHKKVIAELYNAYRELKFSGLPKLDEKNSELMARLDGTQVSESIYILDALNRTINVDGDVCEFGVAQGYTSALIAHNILGTSKKFYLFDSFKGLPAPTSKDKLIDDIFDLKDIHAYTGTMSHPQQSVINNLKRVNFPVERTRIVDGFIEETIRSAEMPYKVSFAYIDFDFYEPIAVALNFLNNVIQKGGVIIVDDYGFFSAGAKAAVDEFVAVNKNNFHFELPLEAAGKFAILSKL